MANRAAIVARVSTTEQREKGTSIGTQLDTCRKYALDHGWDIVLEVADDISGTVPVSDRPGGRKVYELLAKGAVDHIVLYTMDRSNRDKREYPLDYLVFLADVQDAGADLHFCDTGLADGGIVNLIYAVEAARERRKIRERLTNGRNRRASEGHVMAAKPPYGYTFIHKDGKRTIEPDQHAETVKMIFDWYTRLDSDRLTMRAIAEKLEALGVPTWAEIYGNVWRKQKRWSWATVRAILKNSVYVGEWVNCGSLIIVPAIIDRKTWEAAQRQRRENQISAVRNRKYRYMLIGHVKCECGASMCGVSTLSRHKTKTYFYYRCNAEKETFYYGYKCKNQAIPRDVLDAVVWRQIRKWMTEPEQMKLALTEHQAEKEAAIAPLRSKRDLYAKMLIDNVSKREKLLDLYLDGEFEKDILQERKSQFDKAIKTLEQELTILDAEINGQILTDEQIGELLNFAQAISIRIEGDDKPFDDKRAILDMLNVQVFVYHRQVDKRRRVRVVCAIGEESLSVADSLEI